MNKQLIFFLVLSLFALSSCRSDKLAEPVVSNCAEPYNFEADVKPILQEYCATAGCHNGSVFPSVLDYSVLSQSVTTGRFVREVLENRSMPPVRVLSEEEYKLIQCWVESGHPEN